MAEVIVRIAASVSGPDGESYTPQVCGRRSEEGSWEGWIEFVSVAGSRVLRTPRETEQSARDDLAYWATGLSTTYLEGALQRALDAEGHGDRDGVGAPPRPHFPAPAPHAPAAAGPARGAPVRPHAVLDPFAVYRQGEETLRRELLALHPQHLRAVLLAYSLTEQDPAEVDGLDRIALAELILAAVRRSLR
jgi:hypothetical protein